MSGWMKPVGGCVAGALVVPGATVGALKVGAGVGLNSFVHAYTGVEDCRKIMAVRSATTATPAAISRRLR
jgi:hypothetical protein